MCHLNIRVFKNYAKLESNEWYYVVKNIAHKILNNT